MILANNLETRGIIIDPLDNDSEEQVSVDLSVGGMYQHSGDNEWRYLGDEITIRPGTCVLIQTNETLKMPNNAFGILHTKGSMGAKGVLVANTKLDPLFEGNLNIPVYNSGNRKVTLTKGQKFCSIAFWKTEGPVVGSKTRNAIRLQARDGSRVKDFFSHNMPHIITAVASVVSSVAAAFLTISFGG